ncbi:hypothetical protein [Photorhabdus sp. CRCIA-P01]
MKRLTRRTICYSRSI